METHHSLANRGLVRYMYALAMILWVPRYSDLQYIFPMHVTVILGYGLLSRLYDLLGDEDTGVVSNCIAALSEILASEGGMVVNTGLAHCLLHKYVYGYHVEYLCFIHLYTCLLVLNVFSVAIIIIDCLCLSMRRFSSN